MIRVLEDLHSYACVHDLTALAEHLDQARLLALVEIGNLPTPDDPDALGEGG